MPPPNLSPLTDCGGSSSAVDRQKTARRTSSSSPPVLPAPTATSGRSSLSNRPRSYAAKVACPGGLSIYVGSASSWASQPRSNVGEQWISRGKGVGATVGVAIGFIAGAVVGVLLPTHHT